MPKNVSRRNFLLASGAALAGAVASDKLLAQTKDVLSTGYLVAQGGGLETTSIKLGFLPIFEAIPLIIAKEKGFFTKHGMKDAEVAKQSSWASARDNVVIGSANGGTDGGQWQMPMPYLITEGLITNGNKKVPMYVLLQTSTQGNGIAIANKHRGKNIGLRLGKAKAYIEGLKAAGTPFTAAFTFPRVNQDLWIRYWLAAGGIDPNDDVKLITVPPAQTVANMKTGTMDGFSTGDPWPSRILEEDVGFMGALTAQIWPFHPEEYLAIRADWVDKNPKATRAVLRAVMEAQQWCDNPKNHPEIIQILGKANYTGLPAKLLTPPLAGSYDMGDGQPKINNRNLGPLFWKDGRGSVSYPYKSHDTWFLIESMRWGFLPANLNYKAWVNKVNREDIWRDAAKQLGVKASDIPKGTSRGVETFFDGVKFDPANPTAYLKSLKIKKVKV